MITYKYSTEDQLKNQGRITLKYQRKLSYKSQWKVNREVSKND